MKSSFNQRYLISSFLKSPLFATVFSILPVCSTPFLLHFGKNCEKGDPFHAGRYRNTHNTLVYSIAQEFCIFNRLQKL